MKRLLVSYDLMRPGQNYEDLWKYLKSFTHKKPLESFWLIATNKSQDSVRDEIVELLIDSNDKVVVIDTTGDAAAWHPNGLPWMKNSEL